MSATSTEDVKKLVQQVKTGKISVSDALQKSDIPAMSIADIDPPFLAVEAIPSGFNCFDEIMLLKKQYGELICIGARPGMGKSAFMVQLASYVARTENVLYVSFEMSKEQIYRRMVAATLEKPLPLIQKGLLKPEDKIEAKRRLSQLKLWIEDRNLMFNELINNIKVMHKQLGLGLVVIDYLQIIKTPMRGKRLRDEEIGDITSRLAALAKELQIPIIVGSQLNRSCENRGRENGDYRPIPADLRESGNIEQDSSIIVFISREEVYNNQRTGEADFIVAKNRDGQLKSFVLRFIGNISTFRENEGV